MEAPDHGEPSASARVPNFLKKKSPDICAVKMIAVAWGSLLSHISPFPPPPPPPTGPGSPESLRVVGTVPVTRALRGRGGGPFGLTAIRALLGRHITLSIGGTRVICATGVRTANILTAGLRVWFWAICRAITVRINLPLCLFLPLSLRGSVRLADTALLPVFNYTLEGDAGRRSEQHLQAARMMHGTPPLPPGAGRTGPRAPARQMDVRILLCFVGRTAGLGQPANPPPPPPGCRVRRVRIRTHMPLPLQWNPWKPS